MQHEASLSSLDPATIHSGIDNDDEIKENIIPPSHLKDTATLVANVIASAAIGRARDLAVKKRGGVRGVFGELELAGGVGSEAEEVGTVRESAESVTNRVAGADLAMERERERERDEVLKKVAGECGLCCC